MPSIDFTLDWSTFYDLGTQMIDFLATPPYSVMINIAMGLGLAGIALLLLFSVSTSSGSDGS